MTRGMLLGLGMAALAMAPGIAGVREGIVAWQGGDYAAAVAQWRPGAAAGDPDAEFNLAQAYKLGHGVPQDLAQAQALYYKAAQQGHAQAEANYGLILFQQGDQAGAMPWLQKAAQQGDARAQYVVGTALFNGDFAGKDWPRAYAYMTRAAAAGLPQAANSLAQMDSFMPLADRQRGAALARSLAQGSRSVPASSLAGGAPLASASGAAFGTPGIAGTPLPASTAADDQLAAATPPTGSKQGRTPGRKVAFADAPATANFDAPASPAAPAAPPPPAAVAPTHDRTPPAPAPRRAGAAEPDARPAPGGKWRLQLGAYGSATAANAAWKTISRAPGLGGLDHFAVAAGAVTRLQAGPFATRDAAAKACARAKTGGANCFVIGAP